MCILYWFQTGAKSGKVKAEYKHDLVTVNSDVDINLGGPLVNASAVVGHKGWLAGYQLAFDTGKSNDIMSLLFSFRIWNVKGGKKWVYYLLPRIIKHSEQKPAVVVTKQYYHSSNR